MQMQIRNVRISAYDHLSMLQERKGKNITVKSCISTFCPFLVPFAASFDYEWSVRFRTTLLILDHLIRVCKNDLCGENRGRTALVEPTPPSF
jgi:hypothetical protein